MDGKKPSPLSIDLNEIPAESDLDAYDVVCRIHGALKPPMNPAAEHPGEAGGAGAEERACGFCARVEVRGATVVCDGCERGFHLGCLRQRDMNQALAGDWICGECALTGPTKNRWALGVSDPRRILDINQLPPADGEELRRTNDAEDSLVSGFGGQYPYANLRFSSDSGNHSGRTVQPFLEAIAKHGSNTGTGYDLVLGSSLRGRSAANPASVSGQLKEEFFLHSLRDFVTEKGGVLADGWHVELKESQMGSDSYAIYCAPDGLKFESMFDVARHLGISFGLMPVENNEKHDGCGTVQRRPTPRRRKKELRRSSMSHKIKENEHGVRSSSGRELSSVAEDAPQCFGVTGNSRVNTSMEENGVSSENLVELPVQYEDFFVNCLGKVELRTAYHDEHHIWPLGYRSSWHDKITGSHFECEVSDGGDSGPVFRIRRRPCSLSSIPKGKTVLKLSNSKKTDIAVRPESTVIFDADYNTDDDILLFLSDPSPSEQDLLSWYDHDTSGNSFGASTLMDLDHPERTGGLSVDTSLRDEIGEFCVEGTSSSSAWKMITQTFIDSCQEVYKQRRQVQFHCMHRGGVLSSNWDDSAAKDVRCIETLDRFCSSFGPIDAQVIRNDIDLEESCKSLGAWLDQDRFGLNIGFVQEIIETLPASRACSGYQFLNKRDDFLMSLTVGSGFLVAGRRNRESGLEEVVTYGLYSSKNSSGLQGCVEDPSVDRHPPPGRPLSNELPAELAGDIFQISEVLWRFREILGLKETLTFEDLAGELVDPWPCSLDNLRGVEREKMNQREQIMLGSESSNHAATLHASAFDQSIDEQHQFKLIPVDTASTREATEDKVASYTYWRCTGVALTKAHTSLLKVLVSELLNKVSAYIDPNFDSRDSKPRRGRKKDVDNSFLVKEPKNDLLPINELTWPELARRYVLAVLSLNGRMDSQEVFGREGVNVIRCLQGDGGVLCGSLTGIAGIAADSLLLAEADMQILDTSKLKCEVLLPVDYKNTEDVHTSEAAVTSNGLPEWAEPLEPVKKLPTNVGTRIRKCVQNALDKNPPQWAKERLLYSISKEVYKGNASGPTKKAALSVLADAASSESEQPKPDNKSKTEIKPVSVSDAIMKKCRIVLRRAACADESKTFCNLLGSTLLSYNYNDDKGIVGSPATVSRPLDFRTIDLRLAAGAYCGSHETFVEDVREMWHNLSIAYGDQPDLLQKIEALSQNFESLYEKEVLQVMHKLEDQSAVEQLDDETLKELNDVLIGENGLSKAPWEDGVCKVCGVDKDDVSVLLCDKCNSEYHKYCLNPPLMRIPEGNWYCPSCAMSQRKQDASLCTQNIRSHPRHRMGDESWSTRLGLDRLAKVMEEKEYWEFSTEERIMLLKFLCDEVLNSAIVREHLEQCVDQSNDLQQKLRALTLEWKNLKFREDLLTMRFVNEYTNRPCGTGGFLREEGTTAMHADQGCLTGQQYFSSKMIYATAISGSPLKDGISVEFSREDNGRAEAKKDFGHLLSSMIEKHANSNMPSAGPDFVEAPAQSNDLLSKITIQGTPSTTSNAGEFDGKEQKVVSSDKLYERGEEVVLGVDYKDIQRGLEVAKSVDLTSATNAEIHCTVQSKADKLHNSTLPSTNGRNHSGESAMTMVPGGSVLLDESRSGHENGVAGNQFKVHAGISESEMRNLELTSLKSEISQLQDTFACLESQLMMTSLRKDFLGQDSIGRSYWVAGKPGKRPRLVVGGGIPAKRRKRAEKVDVNSTSSSISFRHRSDIRKADDDLSLAIYYSTPLVVYESDSEIQQLVNWLRDNDTRERELKESILRCQRPLYQQGNISTLNNLNLGLSSCSNKIPIPGCSMTKAAVILENKYGPSLSSEVNEIAKKRGKKPKLSNEGRMYRCECLELVWPGRHHCLFCHQTYCTIKEMEGHNEGKCFPVNPSSDEAKDNDDSIKGKGKGFESSSKGKDDADAIDTTETSRKGKFDTVPVFVKFKRKASPFDFDEICKKFHIDNSLKESVKKIGLIGSNGVPSLISSQPTFFDPPSVLNRSKCNSDIDTLPMSTNNELDNIISGPGHEVKSFQTCNGDNIDILEKSTSEGAGEHEASKAQVPETALRPLVGKVSHIIKWLKISLLDMDAALPEEAFRPSKSDIERRCAWRAFVKSAESIFEMVQATVLLELMIRSDYLKNGWWYWSSLTAAAKTPSVASLAFRVYALDDSIIYLKDKEPRVSTPLDQPADTFQLMRTAAEKKKDTTADEPS